MERARGVDYRFLAFKRLFCLCLLNIVFTPGLFLDAGSRLRSCPPFSLLSRRAFPPNSKISHPRHKIPAHFHTPFSHTHASFVTKPTIQSTI